MTNYKTGLIVVLIGLFIHVTALGFIKYYNPALGFIGSMDRMDIVLAPGILDWKAAIRDGIIGEHMPDKIPGTYYEGRIALPYKIVFFFSNVVVIVGVFLMIIKRKEKHIYENMVSENVDRYRYNVPGSIKIIGVFFCTLVVYVLAKDIFRDAWWLRIIISLAGLYWMLRLWYPDKKKDTEDL